MFFVIVTILLHTFDTSTFSELYILVMMNYNYLAFRNSISLFKKYVKGALRSYSTFLCYCNFVFMTLFFTLPHHFHNCHYYHHAMHCLTVHRLWVHLPYCLMYKLVTPGQNFLGTNPVANSFVLTSIHRLWD